MFCCKPERDRIEAVYCVPTANQPRRIRVYAPNFTESSSFKSGVVYAIPALKSS